MEPCLAMRPADAPVDLLRPCCAHSRRSRWLVSRAVVVQLAACAICAAAPSVRAEPVPPKVAPAEALTPPKVTHGVRAVYPPEAAASGREADVVVLATVGKTGDVTAVEVAEHGGDPFDDAALGAARQWKFTPALRNGRPIESQVRIPFHFRHGLAPEAVPPPAPGAAVPAPSAAVPAPSAAVPAPSAAVPAPSAAVPAPSAAVPAPSAAVPAPPVPAASPSAAPPPAAAPVPPTVTPEAHRAYESSVAGRLNVPSRGASDYHVDVGALSLVPHANAAEFLKLAPGILLTNEGGEAHAEQVFLRGFDAREGQDIEFSVDGVPINESGNLHGNGYADTHFIIPELVRVAARARGAVRSAAGQLRRRRLRRLPPRPRQARPDGQVLRRQLRHVSHAAHLRPAPR